MHIPKRYILQIFLSFFCISLALSALGQRQKAEKKRIAAEMKFSMVNKLLKQWYPLAVDEQYGGFLSSFSYDFKPIGNQDKMIVTQARHTWSNAKAAELFPKVKYYKASARHGFLFLKNVLWDKQHGGFYTYTDRQGNVKKGGFAPKEAYGNSFAIYALSAYYQLSGDTSALNLAIADFRWLEKHSHDPVYKGYFEHMERDGTPIKRDASTPTTAETGYKDQNSSIHLLESFTELYTVWPNALLKDRLNEMLLLVRDKITNPKGDLILFFQPDWTPVSYRDSSEAVMMKHHGLDHVSFGHNVETAYLMLEASHTIGIKNDTATLRVGKKMLDDALENGWDKQVGGFYDEGYYFKNKPGTTIIADTKNWWAQAEGLNTLLMFSDFYPKDQHHYFDKFKQLWNYVQTYLIDQVNGDWYQGGLDKQPEYKLALKGQIWKGTYHNFRALMNCLKQLRPDHTPPTAPAFVKSHRHKNFISLKWRPSTDNRHVLGYNIYAGKTRVAYTPLLHYQLIGKFGRQPIKVTSLDLQGNESQPGRALK